MALIRNILAVLVLYFAAWYLYANRTQLDLSCHTKLGDYKTKFEICEHALEVCLERP